MQLSRVYRGDRCRLGLRRAAADAVIGAAGTLRKQRDSTWTAERAFPDARADFAALRTALGTTARPLTVIVTGSGDIDLGLPVFTDGGPVLIASTAAGAKRLGAVPAHLSVRAVAEREPLRAAELVRVATEATGGLPIPTEGGPTVLARFFAGRLGDDLFLTIGPLIPRRP